MTVAAHAPGAHLSGASLTLTLRGIVAQTYPPDGRPVRAHGAGGHELRARRCRTSHHEPGGAFFVGVFRRYDIERHRRPRKPLPFRHLALWCYSPGWTPFSERYCLSARNHRGQPSRQTNSIQTQEGAIPNVSDVPGHQLSSGVCAHAREAGDPLESVASIELLGFSGDRGIAFSMKDGTRVEYRNRGNGFRWWCAGWCSRDRVDRLLGVEGGAWMLQRLWWLLGDDLQRHHDDLDAVRERVSEHRELALKFVRRAGQRAREQRANGRHLALREWRGSNPVPRHEIPEPLQKIRGIQRLDPDQPCHVYFLVHRGEVVYVGQTATTWPSRVESHLNDGSKEFDEVWYLPVDRVSLTEVEARYIRELQPKYNKQHTGATP